MKAEWTLGVMNEERRTDLLENFQGPHRESNRGPPFLWRNASTLAPLDLTAHSVTQYVSSPTAKHRLVGFLVPTKQNL